MIPLFKVYMKSGIEIPVGEVLNSGYVGQGAKVDEFEVVLKDYFNNDRVVTVNSATSGEHLALTLLQKPQRIDVNGEWGSEVHSWPGLSLGDEILCSPLTCTASNWPVILGGYKIKWVDIDPLTLNMDLDDLARKITPSTKAVMLPFWGGMPVDLHKLKKIQTDACRQLGFKPAIILDLAHGLNSKFEDKYVCNFGHISSFSFQAIKHITSIDGGVLILPHNELHRRAKLLRWYGIEREEKRSDFRCESDIVEIGTKWHMNDVNATVGMYNFVDVDHITSIHRDNAKFYNTHLSDVCGVTTLTPTINSDSAYWIYTILVEKREQFMRRMVEKGITVSRVHERNDKHSAVSNYRSILPSLEKVMPKYCCIPVGWWVNEEQRNYIIDTIKEGW